MFICSPIRSSQDMEPTYKGHHQRNGSRRCETHPVKFCSTIKKNEIMPCTATWMGQEITILSGVRQWKTDILWYHLYVEEKKDTNELICSTETDSQTLKTNLSLPKGTGTGGMDWGVGIGICTVWYTEWLTNGDLLYSAGNSIQYFVIIYMGKESEK